jgi:PleD family two-component response regulator
MEILYVHDDAEEIALLVEALHNADRSIKFSYALDIYDALRKLNNYLAIPDAIFVDCHLGGLDGFECVKQIKAREELKHVPVVMVSAILTPGMIDELNKLGVYNFLSKDALHSEMVLMLKVLLECLSRPEKNPS